MNMPLDELRLEALKLSQFMHGQASKSPTGMRKFFTTAKMIVDFVTEGDENASDTKKRDLTVEFSELDADLAVFNALKEWHDMSVDKHGPLTFTVNWRPKKKDDDVSAERCMDDDTQD